MLRLPRIEVSARIVPLIGLFVLLSPVRGTAMEAVLQENEALPCAILQDFGGDVQIFDATRTQLLKTGRKAKIPCGGWVSVGSGWAEVNHRDGHEVNIGSKTFVGFPDNNADGKYSGDQVVLYRGQVYVHTDGGNRELRVITASARARLTRGTAIVVYSEAEEESQLITLENLASLENRYETSRIIKVRSGEASAMNMQLLRVVPSIPRAIALASLRAKLADLHIDERTSSKAMRAARDRQERKFAAKIDSQENQRKPASVSRYERHEKHEKEDAELHEHWVKRMVAGEKVGESILFPDQFYGRPQRVKVEVTDKEANAPGMRTPRQKAEDAEKKRLIEELSAIRIE